MEYVSRSFQSLLVKQRNLTVFLTVTCCLVFRFGWQYWCRCSYGLCGLWSRLDSSSGLYNLRGYPWNCYWMWRWFWWGNLENSYSILDYYVLNNVLNLLQITVVCCHVQFHKAVVIDHIKYAVTKLGCDHSLIAADNLIDSPVILGSEGIKVGLIFFWEMQTCTYMQTSLFADEFVLFIKISCASELQKRLYVRVALLGRVSSVLFTAVICWLLWLISCYIA